MTSDEFVQTNRAHHRSVNLHLLALLVLLIIEIVSFLRSSGAFDIWWWIGLSCMPVAVLIYLRVKWKIEDRMALLNQHRRGGQ